MPSTNAVRKVEEYLQKRKKAKLIDIINDLKMNFYVVKNVVDYLEEEGKVETYEGMSIKKKRKATMVKIK